jgi:hypothetical protein
MLPLCVHHFRDPSTLWGTSVQGLVPGKHDMRDAKSKVKAKGMGMN